MKTYFESIANELHTPLVYAQPNLANVLIDKISPDDFSAEGLIIVVTPLRSSIAVDQFGRMRRAFEIGVLGLINVDYNEEEIDTLTTKAFAMLKKVVSMAGGDMSTVNIVTDVFDAMMGGVYANVTLRPSEGVCHENE